MALCIMVIARVASIPLWMRSEPWAGFFINPSICFCGLWSYLGTVLNYVGNSTFKLNLLPLLFNQTWFVITLFHTLMIEMYLRTLCNMWLYVESCTILVVVTRLSRPVVVLDGLPGLYGFKYDSATACGFPLYLYSYKLVGSATQSAVGRPPGTCGSWQTRDTWKVDSVINISL